MAIVLMASACGAHPNTGGPNLNGPNELQRIFDEDQTDRTPSFTMEEFAHFSREKADSLTKWLDDRDAARLVKVDALMKAGAAKSAVDYYHAAMIMQHAADTVSNLRAHAWIKKALEIDSSYTPAKYLFAASWDRIQIRRGLPQWYGTNVNRAEDGTAYIAPIDTTKVTEAERKRLTGWTLAQRRASIDSLNRAIRNQK